MRFDVVSEAISIINTSQTATYEVRRILPAIMATAYILRQSRWLWFSRDRHLAGVVVYVVEPFAILGVLELRVGTWTATDLVDLERVQPAVLLLLVVDIEGAAADVDLALDMSRKIRVLGRW